MHMLTNIVSFSSINFILFLFLYLFFSPAFILDIWDFDKCLKLSHTKHNWGKTLWPKYDSKLSFIQFSISHFFIILCLTWERHLLLLKDIKLKRPLLLVNFLPSCRFLENNFIELSIASLEKTIFQTAVCSNIHNFQNFIEHTIYYHKIEYSGRPNKAAILSLCLQVEKSIKEATGFWIPNCFFYLTCFFGNVYTKIVWKNNFLTIFFELPRFLHTSDITRCLRHLYKRLTFSPHHHICFWCTYVYILTNITSISSLYLLILSIFQYLFLSLAFILDTWDFEKYFETLKY